MILHKWPGYCFLPFELFFPWSQASLICFMPCILRIAMATDLTSLFSADNEELLCIIKSGLFGSLWNFLLRKNDFESLFRTASSFAFTSTTTSDILSSFSSLNRAASMMLILFLLALFKILWIMSGWLMEFSLLSEFLLLKAAFARRLLLILPFTIICLPKALASFFLRSGSESSLMPIMSGLITLAFMRLALRILETVDLPFPALPVTVIIMTSLKRYCIYKQCGQMDYASSVSEPAWTKSLLCAARSSRSCILPMISSLALKGSGCVSKFPYKFKSAS